MSRTMSRVRDDTQFLTDLAHDASVYKTTKIATTREALPHSFLQTKVVFSVATVLNKMVFSFLSPPACEIEKKGANPIQIYGRTGSEFLQGNYNEPFPKSRFVTTKIIYILLLVYI